MTLPARTPGTPAHPRRRSRAVALATAGVLLAGVAACTGGGAGSSSGSGAGSEARPPAAAGDATAGTADAAGGAPALGVDAVDLQAGSRSVVSTADLTVEVADVDAAAAAVVRLAASAGGLVAASSSGADGAADQAHLSVRVPGDRFSTTLDALAGLGRRTALTTTATDVTAEVADVGSRVTSAQAVLATFRARLPQATTIPDVLAVEGEIARRQADLEALQARQRALADSVDLATVQVALQARPDAAVAAAAARPGFLGGVRSGWAALGSVVGIAALLAGAVLPFLLPVAVVAVPLVLLRRRRSRAAAAASTPAA